MKKSGEYFVQIFRHSKRKFRDSFASIYGKLVKNYRKNVKLFWENFDMVWRNYKIIISGTFWKFLGKYVCQASFVKQISNYLLKTLKKCWKFVENFWGILDRLYRSILNIFIKSRKNFQKLLEKLRSKCWINFGKIMRKHQINFILDTDFVEIKKEILKILISIRINISVENIATYRYWKFFDIDTTIINA